MRHSQTLNLKQLKQLAANMGRKNRNKDLLLGFSGQLGSGKTTFIKAFAAGLGVKKIKSPTFIIMASYQTPGKRRFYHLDFYRIRRISELKSLGFGEILASRKRIIVIEWIDKFPKLAKKCNILARLDIISKNTRNVQITIR